MSETLLGVLIGGAICVVPNLIIFFASVWNERKRQKFETRMVFLNIYEKDRQNAIREFNERFGSVAFGDIAPGDEGFDNFISSGHRAALYVSADTRDAIHATLRIALDGWDRNRPGTTRYYWDELRKTLTDLQVALHEEMSSYPEITKNPTGKRKQKP